ncbi:hypothetical protein Aph01nite_67710 [Acrocarpospora phusangensis]|uniref:Fibronectin type-III domain-containing protein n=1 Tax=Acrocarpospora phusangensis TaxID=1070424 RepID=A0A919QIH1_9ACTN|nr:fibronectin type III domain-containing protein [Acrocarpospora phusangensis]GIH28461.1 hypothetical protein Aph01nite_67710 [Acrocarpospora phusangensis]
MRTALKLLTIAAGVVLLTGSPAIAAVDTRPPSAPGNLRSTAVTQTGVTLAWNRSTDNVKVVWYAAWAPGLTPVVYVDHPTTTASFTGLRPGVTYPFRVQAWDGRNWSLPSNIVNVTTQPDVLAPSAPSALTLANNVHGTPVDSVTASTALLNWSNSTDDFGPIRYEVLVNGVPSPNVYDVRPAGSPILSSSRMWVRQLEPGTTYSLSVRAVDSGGNLSAPSAPLTVTTDASGDVLAPSTPTLTSASGGGTGYCPDEIWARWTASTDDQAPASALEYELRSNGTILEVITGGTRTIAYTEIFGTNAVTIVAVDPAGNASAPSNVVNTSVNWGTPCGNQ